MTTAVDRSLLYAQTRFGVTIPALNVQVGFFTELTGMSLQVDVMEYPEGGLNDYVHKLPGRVKHNNVTLKRGVTNETALLEWVKANTATPTPTSVHGTSAPTLNQCVWTPIPIWPDSASTARIEI